MQDHERFGAVSPGGESPIVPPAHPTPQPGPLVDASGETVSSAVPRATAPRPVAYPTGDESRSRAAELKHRATELSHRAGDYARTAEGKVREFRHTAARALHDAASKLHGEAAEAPGGDRTTDWAHRAGRGLDVTAEYLDSHDVSDMTDDLRMCIRQRPLESLGVSVVLGFLLGRALRRS